MKNLKIIISLLILPYWICCTPGNREAQARNTVGHTVIKNGQGQALVKSSTVKKDEKDFRAFFSQFIKVLGKKDINSLAPLMHFPFYTSQTTVPNGMGAASDPITAAEFGSYNTAIFNQDVMRLLLAGKEDSLSEIDDKTDEIYYKSLQKLTDPGSKLYEAYLQYPEPNNQAESYFGLIFGRVNGKFKVIASYAKWPIK